MGLMARDHSLQLTEEQLLHQRVMTHVVLALQDTPYILKGGTALLLTRGLDRHSIDLDFDSGKKINIEKRIQQGLAAIDVKILSLTIPKDTGTVQRFKVHYHDKVSGFMDLLKVETSFRSQPVESQVETVNGIRTYKIEYIIDQKIASVYARTRARDLYDLEFLARMYGNHFSQVQIQHTNSLLSDPDGLVTRFDETFSEDHILAGRTSADTLVLNLQETIDCLQGNIA